jgi:hypothetical protein
MESREGERKDTYCGWKRTWKEERKKDTRKKGHALRLHFARKKGHALRLHFAQRRKKGHALRLHFAKKKERTRTAAALRGK